MNNSFSLRLLLIIILSTHIFTPIIAQKDVKEFPKAKVMTVEELQRMENDRKQNEEFQKKQELEQAAWAKKYRISEYSDTLRNDIFKFSFFISTLLAIFICFIRGKRLEYYLPFLSLIGLYLLHCGLYSKNGEFSDCLISGIKAALISLLCSIIMISVFTRIVYRSHGFSNEQKMFAIIITLLSTAFIAYLLTMNIESLDSDKPLFISYPWNWLGFSMINGFLFYRLKIVNTSNLKRKQEP